MVRAAALICALLLMGCNSDPPTPYERAMDRQAELEASKPVGRYQIQNVTGTGQAILLDTATGQTWYRVSTGPSDVDDVTQWIPMERVSLEAWNALNRSTAPAKPE